MSTGPSSLPSLFLPHGAPDLAVSGHTAADFLQQLSNRFPRPDGIVIVSAHWETDGLRVTTAKQLETMHDYSGFGPELANLVYPARTDRSLIDMLSGSLAASGYALESDTQRGLDHGAWVPLLLAYPAAEVPVVQLSLDRSLTGEGHFGLGRALAALRADNVLVIGSGGVTHNLHRLGREGTPPEEYAVAFDNWLNGVLSHQDWQSLTQFEACAPDVHMAHPTVEHFLPLIIAAGAGGPGAKAVQLHHSYSYGSISMSSWAFGSPAAL
jgi:4,5-DOPA dioxygenase extradiol